MESPVSYGCRRILGPFRTRNDFVAPCYGKVDIACQAIDGAGQPSDTVGPAAVECEATGAPPRLRDICTRIRKS